MLRFFAIMLTFLAGAPDRVPDGTWGGERLMVEVAADGAGVEFDCGVGRMEGPLILKGGAFEVKGTYRREAGPVRADGSDVSPAVYRGKLDGDDLTLTITLEGAQDPMGTWTVTKGKRIRLMKCR
jgi:hypothetical protein